MRLQIKEGFPCSYQAKQIPELTNNGDVQIVHFTPDSIQRPSDGLLVEITPKDRLPWIGVFGFGEWDGDEANGIFRCPDQDAVCVVSRGRGYIVQANDPDLKIDITPFPVVDVIQLPTHGLICFVGLTSLSAYGKDGLRWKTGRLSWDGLKVTAVDPTIIRGSGWDASTGLDVDFVIDITTGQPIGGASPPR